MGNVLQDVEIKIVLLVQPLLSVLLAKVTIYYKTTSVFLFVKIKTA